MWRWIGSGGTDLYLHAYALCAQISELFTERGQQLDNLVAMSTANAQILVSTYHFWINELVLFGNTESRVGTEKGQNEPGIMWGVKKYASVQKIRTAC